MLHKLLFLCHLNTTEFILLPTEKDILRIEIHVFEPAISDLNLIG